MSPYRTAAERPVVPVVKSKVVERRRHHYNIARGALSGLVSFVAASVSGFSFFSIGASVLIVASVLISYALVYFYQWQYLHWKKTEGRRLSLHRTCGCRRALT